jgi:hypothetical protein
MLHTLNQLADTWMWFARSCVVVGLVIAIGYSFSRSPPYRLLSYQVEPVRPGGYAVFHSRVWRDKKRDCSVQYSRFLKFADGSELAGPVTIASDAMIDDLERDAPGEATVRVLVPEGVPPGPATMRTVLHYRCNPTQYVLPPIEVTVQRNFYILP